MSFDVKAEEIHFSLANCQQNGIQRKTPKSNDVIISPFVFYLLIFLFRLFPLDIFYRLLDGTDSVSDFKCDLIRVRFQAQADGQGVRFASARQQLSEGSLISFDKDSAPLHRPLHVERVA